MKVLLMRGTEPSKLSSFGAIQTAYRAFEFRSRLEAKWAMFFDLCGWNWAYEPTERHGYIPDFVLGFRPTLVEVKPFFHMKDWSDPDKGNAIQKIIQSGINEPVILLGDDPTWISVSLTVAGDMAPAIGWLAEPISIDGQRDFEITRLHFGYTEGNRKLGLCPLDSGWVNLIHNPPDNCQAKNKWARVELERADIEKQLVERWANAGNVAKWMPTKPKTDELTRR